MEPRIPESDFQISGEDPWNPLPTLINNIYQFLRTSGNSCYHDNIFISLFFSELTASPKQRYYYSSPFTPRSLKPREINWFAQSYPVCKLVEPGFELTGRPRERT